jgi:hypothetical protein
MEHLNNPQNPATRGEGQKMEMAGIDPGLVALLKDNNGDDKTLWLFLLLLLYGKDGFGGRAGGECCPPTTLEQLNDAQNAIQNGQIALSNRIGDQTSNIIRDIGNLANTTAAHTAGIQAGVDTASNLNLLGQKDLSAAIAECCCQNLLSQKDTQKAIEVGTCETTRAIEKCCCENQNAIAMQTQVLSQQICQDGDKTRALITQNKIDELQAQLTDAKLANSNLSQTGVLQQSIREACCQPCRPCHPHPWLQIESNNIGE